jgi:hypothetical protein
MPRPTPSYDFTERDIKKGNIFYYSNTLDKYNWRVVIQIHERYALMAPDYRTTLGPDSANNLTRLMNNLGYIRPGFRPKRPRFL